VRPSRVAVLSNPGRRYPSIELGIKQVKAVAKALGLSLQDFEARSPDQFESSFAAISQMRADALLVIFDSMFWQHRRRLAELEAKYRLPAMHALREHVEAGSLISYGVNLADLFRRVNVYIDKILHGAIPADLPVEQPTKFELVINLKTAKALGLTIPQ